MAVRGLYTSSAKVGSSELSCFGLRSLARERKLFRFIIRSLEREREGEIEKAERKSTDTSRLAVFLCGCFRPRRA